MTDAVDDSTRLAIETLIHDHAWLIDHGQADQVVDLYTDHARLLGIGARSRAGTRSPHGPRNGRR